MFGLGMGEILLIAVVALLAVGPDRLPQAARSIGRGIRDLRRQTTDLQHALEEDADIGDAVRELRSAWYGTGKLPRNRHELGRALDQMTRDERPPPAKPRAGDPLPDEAPAMDPAGEGEPAETTPDLSDDGLPAIKAPSGTIARGASPDAAEPNQAPAERGPEAADASKPADG